MVHCLILSIIKWMSHGYCKKVCDCGSQSIHLYPDTVCHVVILYKAVGFMMMNGKAFESVIVSNAVSAFN